MVVVEGFAVLIGRGGVGWVVVVVLVGLTAALAAMAARGSAVGLDGMDKGVVVCDVSCMGGMGREEASGGGRFAVGLMAFIALIFIPNRLLFTGVCIISRRLMRCKIASGSCGCALMIFLASSGSRSAMSLSFLMISYISPLFILLSASATACVPMSPIAFIEEEEDPCIPNPEDASI